MCQVEQAEQAKSSALEEAEAKAGEEAEARLPPSAKAASNGAEVTPSCPRTRAVGEREPRLNLATQITQYHQMVHLQTTRLMPGKTTSLLCRCCKQRRHPTSTTCHGCIAKENETVR